jgi:effector-binding domain-containing protein
VGPPLSIYHGAEFDEENMDIEICLPVDRKLSGDGQVSGQELPACKVASTVHPGHYDEIGLAYQAIMGWIKDHGHETTGPPREIYLVGPTQARDPTAYRTEVAWPIGDRLRLAGL